MQSSPRSCATAALRSRGGVTSRIFFFFQAEDGIRDYKVTGVQTCALPIFANFHVNWISPVKIRQMIFAGSKKSVIFNELNTTEPVKVYDRGINLNEAKIGRASCRERV